MELYSYKRETPKILPQRIRLDNGQTRTSLSELSAENLKDLGFIAVEMPELEVDKNVEKIEWDGSNYVVRNLTEEELHEVKIQKISDVDYASFWNKLIETKFYRKIRSLSKNSLPINTIYIEFANLVTDAKSDNLNVKEIQKYLNVIFLNVEFSDTEVKELEDVMKENNLHLSYNIPSQEYISSNVYDFTSNTILNTCPYASWSIVDGKWKSPIEKPNSTDIYIWDEDAYQADNATGWVFSETSAS